MAALSGGRLVFGGMQVAWIDMMGANPLFEEGHNAFRELITAPTHEYPKQGHEFEWLAYVNCILAVLNGMQLSGHGGALILKSNGYDLLESGCVRIKYGLTAG